MSQPVHRAIRAAILWSLLLGVSLTGVSAVLHWHLTTTTGIDLAP